ncbi:dTDP-4-dehydrorhamnose reductase [Anaerosolibacter sp.]|uniref:dTDP-4-dehydrorhamnose reductase n=1 Tax=Anaerosolibacter sp. TaxID=1872527 RepID=UPI0039F0B568
MKILLFGGHGLLGNDIYEVLKAEGHDILRFSRDEVDLLNRSLLKEKIEDFRPQLVINAAGYTDVANAERNFKEAFSANCIGVHNLISACEYVQPTLIHFSTDYVFDGKKTSPYQEEDVRYALNHYGWSKLIAEDIITANYKKFFIIRTSWLFGVNGKCFPKTIVEKLKLNMPLTIVTDQIGSPTYTLDIAKNTINILKMPYGVYHITNSGHVSWYEYAKEIACLLNYKDIKIKSISSDELDTGVERPVNSVLDNSKWTQFNKPLRSYSEALREYLNKIS